MILNPVSYDEFEFFIPDSIESLSDEVWRDELRRRRRIPHRRPRRLRTRRPALRRGTLRSKRRLPINRFRSRQQPTLRSRKRPKSHHPRRPIWPASRSPLVSVNARPLPPTLPPELPKDYPPEPPKDYPPKPVTNDSGGATPEPAESPQEQGSEFIRWVQSTLNEVLQLNLPVDGIMSPATRSAIRTFQERQGLTVDGIVGPSTKEALTAAHQGDKGEPSSANGSTDAPQEEYFLDVSWNRFKNPQSRMNHRSRSYIGWAQQALNKIMGQRLPVDGISDPKMRSVVRDFQRRKGLAVDGLVGPQTEKALIAAGAGQPPRSKAPRPGGVSSGNGRLTSSRKP